MVNLFSSTPCTISGGSCMCGSFTDGFVEPFDGIISFGNENNVNGYENDNENDNGNDFENETGNEPFYNHFNVNTTQQAGAYNPIDSLFSQFFDTPAKQNSVNVHPKQVNNPIVQTLSSQLGVSPKTLQGLLSQVLGQYQINPSELKETLLTFLSRFHVNPNHIRPLIYGTASQLGLNSRMGRPGVINPVALKQALEKSNIPVIPNTQQQATPPTVNQANTRANTNTTQKQQLLNSLQANNILKTPNSVEVPVVHSNNGKKEPVVLKNNGKITTPSGARIALDGRNVLTNLQNGTPVTVNSQIVTVNPNLQLVNAKTGNPVTVLNSNNVAAAQRVNAFYSNNGQAVAANAAPISSNQAAANAPTYNKTYSYANYQKVFPQMTENQYGALSGYTARQQIPLQTINPQNLSRGIDDFLSQFDPNN